jgi:hypothetical protein
MVAAVTTAVSQMSALAVGAYPAAQTQVAQLAALGATAANMETRVSQATMLVAALGSVSDPHVRAWTFTLDGHDYYVLRLGNLETIIYDTLAEQWYDWGSDISASVARILRRQLAGREQSRFLVWFQRARWR